MKQPNNNDSAPTALIALVVALFAYSLSSVRFRSPKKPVQSPLASFVANASSSSSVDQEATPFSLANFSSFVLDASGLSKASSQSNDGVVRKEPSYENMTVEEATARRAVYLYPDSDMEVAFYFSQQIVPEFLVVSSDRFIKLGRSLVSLLELADQHWANPAAVSLQTSLELLIQECRWIAAATSSHLADDPDQYKVPKSRFGKTNLNLSIVSLSLLPEQTIFDNECKCPLEKPPPESSRSAGEVDNAMLIILTAFEVYGINHIEVPLVSNSDSCCRQMHQRNLKLSFQRLLSINRIQRDNVLIQTSIPCYVAKQFSNKNTSQVFHELLNDTITAFHISYIDLLTIQGIRNEEWGSENDENCVAVAKKLKQAGLIRNIGYTMASSPLDDSATEHGQKAIRSNEFDYIIVPYNYFGSSYLTSAVYVSQLADKEDVKSMLNCLKLAREHDLGILSFHPLDEAGGQLYAPSQKLRSLTLPDLEPIVFQSLWVWMHDYLQHDYRPSNQTNATADQSLYIPRIHSFGVAATRPCDLDQAVMAAHLYTTQPQLALNKLKATEMRLDQVMEETVQSTLQRKSKWWWNSKPRMSDLSQIGPEGNQIIWMYNLIQAFGMYEYGKDLSKTLEKEKQQKLEALTNPILLTKSYWHSFTESLFGSRIDAKLVKKVQDFFDVQFLNNKIKEDKANRFYAFDRTFGLSEKSKSLLPRYIVLEEVQDETQSQTNGHEHLPEAWKTAYNLRP